MRTTIVLFFVMFLCEENYSQEQKLLFCCEANNIEQREYIVKNDIQNIYCVYENEFISKDSLRFNKILLEKSLNKEIPDKNGKGFAVLDWEGDSFRILVGRVKSSDMEYDSILLNYIKVIQYAKKLRPNIKWSYYNLPLINYYDSKKNTDKSKGYRCLPLLKELDFFAPSIYILSDKKNNKDSVINQFIDSNIQFTLEMGAKLSKLTYPFVMNRYHPDSKVDGWKLMEPDYFRFIIRRILNLSYGGLKVNGIIWWNHETYLFQNRNKFRNIDNEYLNVLDYKKHEIEEFQLYLNLIKTEL